MDDAIETPHAAVDKGGVEDKIGDPLVKYGAS